MQLINKFRKAYSLYIVRNLWCHWFNPLYTLYFNLIFFPFRQAIKFPIFVYGWPKLFSQYGSMECIGKITTGMIKLNVTMPGGPQFATGNTQLNLWGKIIFHGKCEIGTGNKINVGIEGTLEMGENTKITNFCNISAYTEIQIGAQSRIVHRTQILDTNFHYIADFNKRRINKHARPIIIGKYCWICNSTTVTGGAIIPDKTIVASNSLVGKDFSEIPPESIIGGIPAKLISTGHRRVESAHMTCKIDHYFMENPQAIYFPLQENTNHDICNADK